MKEGIKNKDKSKNQQIYRVRVYRNFDFPSFSVDKNNTLEDITFKAREEVRENHENPDYFKCEIINVLPFSLKTEVEETTQNSDYDFFIREIALESVKDKYGDISYESNPSIYEKRDESAVSVTLYLKPEIELYYLEQVRKFTNVIRNKTVHRDRF